MDSSLVPGGNATDNALVGQVFQLADVVVDRMIVVHSSEDDRTDLVRQEVPDTCVHGTEELLQLLFRVVLACSVPMEDGRRTPSAGAAEVEPVRNDLGAEGFLQTAGNRGQVDGCDLRDRALPHADFLLGHGQDPEALRRLQELDQGPGVEGRPHDHHVGHLHRQSVQASEVAGSEQRQSVGLVTPEILVADQGLERGQDVVDAVRSIVGHDSPRLVDGGPQTQGLSGDLGALPMSLHVDRYSGSRVDLKQFLELVSSEVIHEYSRPPSRGKRDRG